MNMFFTTYLKGKETSYGGIDDRGGHHWNSHGYFGAGL